MVKPQIAVSSMTNADSFLLDGADAALERLRALGVTAVEVSQHIRFDESTVPAFLHARRTLGVGVCAISVRFDGTVPSPLPPLVAHGQTLKAYSSEEDFDTVVDLCRRFGCRYVRFAGFPGGRLRTESTVRPYMEALEAMAARFAAQGITMCVHNHADEFMRADGRLLLDWAMDLAPHLAMELDALNALRCGVDPKALLAQYKGRVPLLHAQDLQVLPSGEGADAWLKPEYRNAPVGEGNVDWPAIVAAAAQAGSEYLIIEQAQFYGRDPYDCIASAVKGLRACL